jgi:hypothetical protein
LTSFPLSGILLSTVALVGGLTRERESEMKNAAKFIKRIQDALGTAEEGDALVEVAQNAQR